MLPSFMSTYNPLEQCSSIMFLPTQLPIDHNRWPMEYILIGILGFLAGYAFELVSGKRLPGVRPALFLVAAGLLLYSLVMICLTSGRLWLPTWAVALGWVTLPISSLLFIRSLFFELPIEATLGTSKFESYLVTTGTYAIVRHPTVPLFLLVLASLLLVSRASLLLIAIPIWGTLDILWIFLQERLVLSKIFPDYEQYRESTPMLIPGRRTMRAFRKAVLSWKAPTRA